MPEKAVAHLWVPPEVVLDKLDRIQIADRIRQWAGKRLVITLESPKRSINQNAYYWSCYIGPIAMAMKSAGWTGNEEQVHEWLARKFLPVTIRTMPDGSEIIERTSTTTLTTSEHARTLSGSVFTSRAQEPMSTARGQRSNEPITPP